MDSSGDNVFRLSERKRWMRISRGDVPDTSSQSSLRIYEGFSANNMAVLHKTLLSKFTQDYLAFVYMPQAYELEVYCKSTTSNETWDSVGAVVGAYKDPATWLVMHHTQNMFVSSPQTSSVEPSVLTSFIIGPHASPNIVLDSIKLVLQCSDIDASNEHKITVQLYNFTTKSVLLSEEMDISKELVAAKGAGETSTWMSVQLFDISALIPKSDDNIWQIKVGVKNSSASVGINSMQNIYYEVREAPTSPLPY